MDDKQGEYYTACVQLSRISDAITTRDFYQLQVNIGNLKRNNYWTGPLLVNVYVYLPVYAEDVKPSPSPSTIFPFPPVQSRFSPQVEELGNFRLAHWSVSDIRYSTVKEWIFTDYVDYFLDFTVPENRSATAYVSVQVTFYHHNALFYSRVADEKIYWLYVESSKGNATMSPQTINIETPVFLAAPLGVDMMLASGMVITSLLYHRRRRLRSTSVETSSKTRKIPIGVFVLVAFQLLFGQLAILIGLVNIQWKPSLASSSIFYGAIAIITALGLVKVKTWAWYIAVIVNAVSIVDHYILFPSLSTIEIPLEPFVLAYLYIRRDVFKV